MAFTYSKLAESTVGAGGASTITFNNIPQNYTDLVLKVSLRNTLADVWDNAEISFNGSTTSYTQRVVRGNGSTATSFSSTTQTSINYWYEVSASATASTFSNGEIYIPNYTSGNNKSVSIDSVTEQNATSAAASLTAGLWSNVSAINLIKLSANGSNFAQYSTATLYGIRVEL